MINYRLVRSKRKTIAIHITEDASIEVRAPLHTSKEEIDRVVISNDGWIQKHIATREQINEKKASFTLCYGTTILLQGKERQVVARNGNQFGFDGSCFFLPPDLSSEEIRQALIELYKRIAKKIFTSKVISYAKLMKVVPRCVKVNSAKTRWGSCSGKNSINFSWLLVMAEEDVIDYVVVHELAHIREHNHSDRFWAIVAEVFPDFRERRAKLAILQNRLSRETWTQ